MIAGSHGSFNKRKSQCLKKCVNFYRAPSDKLDEDLVGGVDEDPVGGGIVTRITNIRGFSLIEAMVTVVIVSVMALGSATLMSDMARESARYRRSLARTNFEQNFVALYQKSNLCSCNLGSTTPISVPDTGVVAVPGLKSGCAPASYDTYDASVAGGFPVDTNLKIGSITVSNPQLISGNDYLATATITYVDSPNFGSLKAGQYLFLFTKTAAAGPPYVVSSCTMGGAISSSGSGSGWTLSGNTGTNPASDFMGTSDDTDVIFKRNSILGAAIRTTASSFGINALPSSTGSSNAAFGVNALNGNTTGSFNVGIGANAGGLGTDAIKQDVGDSNTYIGANSGPLSSGLRNATAIGANAKVGASNSLVLGGTLTDAVNVGIGTTSPSSNLSFSGITAQTIAMERMPFGGIFGSSLNIKAGGAEIGTFDRTGGNLNLSSGISTGTAGSSINFQTATPQGSSSATDNTPSVKMTILGSGNVGIGTTTPTELFELRPPVTPDPVKGKGIYIRTQNGPMDGAGGDFKVVLGGGDSNVGSSGAFSIENAMLSTKPSTLLRVNAMPYNSGNTVTNKNGAGFFRVYVQNDTANSPAQVSIGSEAIVQGLGTAGTTDMGTFIGSDNTAMTWGGGANTLIGTRGNAGAATAVGIATNAYGGYFSVLMGAGSFTNSYGVYTGTIEGLNKWSVYASDAAAPSYFAGRVGVGVTAPTEKLHVVGNLRVQGATDCILGNGAGGTNCSSDIRLKNNVKEIEDPLKKILSLRGVEFEWNQKSQSPGRHDIGVIAQDVEKVFPTAVIEDSSTGFKRVDYAVLVAPIIQAIKALSHQVAELFSSMSAQDREIASLKSRLEALESRLEKAETLSCRKEN